MEPHSLDTMNEDMKQTIIEREKNRNIMASSSRDKQCSITPIKFDAENLEDRSKNEPVTGAIPSKIPFTNVSSSESSDIISPLYTNNDEIKNTPTQEKEFSVINCSVPSDRNPEKRIDNVPGPFSLLRRLVNIVESSSSSTLENLTEQKVEEIVRLSSSEILQEQKVEQSLRLSNSADHGMTNPIEMENEKSLETIEIYEEEIYEMCEQDSVQDSEIVYDKDKNYESRKRHRERLLYNRNMLEILLKEFEHSPYLTKDGLEKMVSLLGISEQRILTWFKNQRAKQRGNFKSFQGKEHSGQKVRIRTIFTPKMLLILENEYQQNNFLSQTAKNRISKALRISEDKVLFWFKNRRSKDVKSKSSS